MIRLATSSDRSAVEALVEAAYGHYVARIGRKPGPMLDDYGALIGQGRAHVLEAGGSLVGLLVLIPEEETMLLDNIAIAPDAQGRGHGRRLLEFAEAEARAAGYGAIRLYTHEKMVENIALYGRIGYAETHRGEEKGLRRVYMVKPLPR